MKKKIEIGDLVKLTGEDWKYVNLQLEDTIVLITGCDDEGYPTFDIGHGMKLTVGDNCGGTIISKAKK